MVNNRENRGLIRDKVQDEEINHQWYITEKTGV